MDERLGGRGTIAIQSLSARRLTCYEADRNHEHLDRKLEVLSQGIQSENLPSSNGSHSTSLIRIVHEDAPSPDMHSTDLEVENETLRRKLDTLERELQFQSPTRSQKKKQQELSFEDDCGTTLFKLNSMSLNSDKGKGASPVKTPGKKVRKFTARKWDLGDENELDGYAAY